MSTKAASDFNEKAKAYLYSVGLRPKNARKGDYSAATEKMMEKVRKLAREEGLEKQVEVQDDDGSLNKLGIFFMKAPEKFAARVKKLDGVYYVEKPAGRKRGTGPKKARSKSI